MSDSMSFDVLVPTYLDSAIERTTAALKAAVCPLSPWTEWGSFAK